MNGSAFLDTLSSAAIASCSSSATARSPRCRRERWAYRLDPESNSLVTLMLHISGNFLSRWSDFLAIRRREAGSGSRLRVRRRASSESGGDPRAVGEGLEVSLRQPVRPHRGGSRAHRHDPLATPHRRRSHSAQPDPYGWPCRPDRLPGEASGRSGLADPQHPPRALGRVQPGDEEESARGLTCRRGRPALARAWRSPASPEGPCRRFESGHSTALRLFSDTGSPPWVE